MYRLALKQSCKCNLQRVIQQQYYRKYNNKNNGIPPEMQEANLGKLLLLLAPVALVGGTVAYANHDREFRKTIERGIPGAETFLKIALQEENPLKDLQTYVSKTIDDAGSSVTGIFGGSTDKSKPIKNVEEVQSTKTFSTPTTAKPVPVNQHQPAPKKEVPAIESSKVVAHKHEEPLPSGIVELERAIEVSATLAVKEYVKAIDILKGFIQDVNKIIEQAIDKQDNTAWNALKNKTSARDTAVSTAEKMAREALDKMEKLEMALSKVINQENQEKVDVIRKKVRELKKHIQKAKDDLYEQKRLSNTSEKYWKNIEIARNYFIEEIESIFPGLNISEKQLNLSKEDLDLFIMHAYSHILAYQKEIQKLQTEGELRLKRAIEAVRGGDADEATKAQLDYLLEGERRKLALDNQRKVFQMRAESEKQLRQQLKKQAAAHIDHLNDALTVKEAEMRRAFSHELEEKVSKERANYKLHLASMLGKMRGIDSALQERADSERAAHQAQALWAACQALWSSVRTGEPGVHWREKLRPLSKEIRVISEVAEGDELVNVVLSNLPRQAEERGVYPEDALRERFRNVERVARRLALVPESGASLPVYLLSYLQSLFIVTPSEPISKDELQNKPFDYSKLDTYDILDRARYFVDRGDLLQALKYMNLLQGAPRKIAQDWLNEARLLLETQQAANTLMAHAAASGLLFL